LTVFDRLWRRGRPLPAALASLAILTALVAVPVTATPAAAHSMQRGGPSNRWMRWNTYPVGFTPTVPNQPTCGRSSMTAGKPHTPCRPPVQVTNGLHGAPNFASHPEWMAVLGTVRDYTFNLSDFGLEPMLSLADNGAYECATWTQGPCTNTTVSIILGDHGLGRCNATGCELGFSSTACYDVNAISTQTCTIAYSEIGLDPRANWAYTQYTTSSGHVNFGQTLEHEIGHSLGLHHPVTGPGSGRVMQCYQANGEALYPNLDGDTISGLGYAYGRYPQANYGNPTVPFTCL
jgi:hypothetical protein